MRPYSQSQVGNQYGLTVDKFTGAIQSQTSTLVENRRRSLSCPTTIERGDFVSPNPWDYTLSNVTALTGSQMSEDAGFRTTLQGVLGSGYFFHPDISSAASSAQELALNRLNEKTRGSLDLATSLAESRQTFTMLNLVKRVTDACNYMRASYLRKVWRRWSANKRKRSIGHYIKRWQRDVKLRYPRAYRPIPVDSGLISRTSSAAANGWLEFTYGLKPLISDIYGVATNVVGTVKNYLNRYHAVGKCAIKESGRIDGPSGHTGRGHASGQYVYRIGLQLKTGFDSGLARWSSLNPLSVGYELLPLSFVVDWFYDVGGYMRNLETSLLYSNQFVRGYVSTLWTYTTSTYFGSSLTNIYGWKSSLSASCSYKATKFNRSVLTSYPLPRPPKIQADLGASRLLSAAALLRQTLKAR